MKLQIFIDKEKEEQVIIYAHQKSRLVEDIERLVSDSAFELVGFLGQQAARIEPCEVCCFVVEDNKIFALLKNERLQIKSRLYQLEAILPSSFVKINQSCLANFKMIERFDASISGTLTIKFKNGYTDYVSRRNLKNVKERLGLK